MKGDESYEYLEATYVSGKALDGRQAPPFKDWLNEYGRKGWLLASMVERSEIMRKGYFCVFVRHVEVREVSQ